MTSILNEIACLRKDRPITIDYKNKNRYRIVIQESNGTKTAYYFSTPIYNVRTRKAVDLKFHRVEEQICAEGSNTDIAISDVIQMKNAEGTCEILLDTCGKMLSEHKVRLGNNSILPTANGLLFKVPCQGENTFCFDLKVPRSFVEIRANGKYFSIMSGKFRPFLTVSCVGTADASGNLIAPAEIFGQKITDSQYRLTVVSHSPMSRELLFEINLYEEKLLQDTTVESGNIGNNNAFGGMAFLGDSAAYGEQWLYSRPDFSKMMELDDTRILKATIHLPRHNRANVRLSAFKVSARFCSFGSNWNNKVPSSTFVSNSDLINAYQSFDVTGLFANPANGALSKSEGLILKSYVKGSGFSAVSTADSYYSPQIIEINYT